MPTPDVTFIAGLDDSQLQSKLQSAGKNTAKLVGGLMPQLQGAAGLLGLVPGAGPLAFYGVAVGAMMQLFRWQDQVAQKAREEREERERSRDAALATAQASIAQGYQQAYGGQMSLRLLEVHQRMQGMRDDFEKARYAAADAAKDINERWDIYADYIANLESVNNLEKDLVSQIEKEVEATGRAVVLRTRVDALMAQGAQAEADTLGEMIKHEQEMAKVQKMMLDNPAVARAAKGEELSRHASRLDQIRKEELERQAAEERTSQRQAEAADAERFKADQMELQLQAKLALARGDEKIADALQKQIEHEQRLRQIREMSGIDEAQRLKLLRLENDLFASDEVKKAKDRGSKTTFAGLGFANSGRIAAQALGGDRAQRDILGEQKKTNQKLDTLIAETRKKSSSVSVFSP